MNAEHDTFSLNKSQARIQENFLLETNLRVEIINTPVNCVVFGMRSVFKVQYYLLTKHRH